MFDSMSEVTIDLTARFSPTHWTRAFFIRARRDTQ